MNFENTISFLLAKVTIAHRNLLQKGVNEAGLHSGQVFILISLWSEDGQRQNNIARSLNLSSPTVNKMIKSLIDGGFLTLQKDETDGRATRIFLTEKGIGIRSKVEKLWQDLEDHVYSNLTETEKIVLFQLLEKTLKNLLT